MVLSRGNRIKETVTPFLLAFLPPVIIVCLCAYMLPEAVYWGSVYSRDHSVHRVNAALLRNSLLSGNGVHGWTNHLFLGYPLNYFYPFGASLYICLLDFLTFGVLDFQLVYAYAFFLFFVFRSLVVYYAGKKLFSRPVGFVAALLFTLDAGWFREGGWLWTVNTGVWPVELSTAFGLLAFLTFCELLIRPSLVRMAWFAICCALALLCHPVQIFFIPLLFIIGLPLRVTYVEDSLKKAFGFAAIGGIVAVCGAAVYLWPMYVLKDFGQFPDLLTWVPYSELGEKLLKGAVFDGTPTLIQVIGVIGTFWLLMSRSFQGIYLALLLLSLLLIGTQMVAPEFIPLDSVSKLFASMQYPRFAGLMKPYLMIAAAYAILAGLNNLAFSRAKQGKVFENGPCSFLPGEGCRWKIILRNGFILVIVAPVIMAVGVELYGDQIAPRRKAGEFHEAYVQLQHEKEWVIEWLNQRSKEDTRFYRIGVWDPQHALTDLMLSVDRPIFSLSMVPAMAYRHSRFTRQPPVLRKISVRYIVVRHWPKKEYAMLKRPRRWIERNCDKIFVGEQLALLELKDWQFSPFDIISGQGEVEVVEWANERIRLTASSGSEGVLRLHLASFPRWSAYHDGVPIEMESVEMEELRNVPLVSVPLRAGDYEFRYKRGVPEFWGEVLSILSFLGCAVVLLFGQMRNKLLFGMYCIRSKIK